ncbi:MAG: hypothetical protein IPL26_15280 [Leptospiraceae bacterium]|nr:hypothetical protein [Leptospiraceae bacterium]
MKFLKISIYAITIVSVFFINCSDKGSKSKSKSISAMMAALPMIRSDIPFLGTESPTGINGQNPRSSSSGIYASRYIPQNFSLSIPVNPQNSPSSQVD